MNLTVVNLSTAIADAALSEAMDAFRIQVVQHLQPEWSITATLQSTTTTLSGMAPIQGNHEALIYVGDSTQDPTTGVPTVTGYHFTNFSKIPYGFVYLDVCAQYGETWTTTLSHEILELLADPDAAMTLAGPAPDGSGRTVYYDFEICDPTQGDSYQINEVDVSNFVGKSYFGLTGGSGKSNYLGLELNVFSVRPHGYLQYEDADGAHQVQGELVTPQQLAAKARMESARRNQRRIDRIKRIWKAGRRHAAGQS